MKKPKRWTGKAWCYVYCPSGKFDNPKAWIMETDNQDHSPVNMPRVFAYRSEDNQSKSQWVRVRVTITPIVARRRKGRAR